MASLSGRLKWNLKTSAAVNCRPEGAEWMHGCVTLNQTARSIKVVLANHTRKILWNISANLYKHFSTSDCDQKEPMLTFFRRWSGYFSCVFMCSFSMSFQENFLSSPYILCLFSVSSFEIAFSSVVILKEFASDAFSPRTNFFSSLTSLELTRKRTMFGKHGIWASILAMMAKLIQILELQFPMIRYFIIFYRQSTRKFLRTSYDCHGFYWLFDWECQVRQNFQPITIKAAKLRWRSK